MRTVIQRVSQASVSVEKRRLAAIGAGLVILLGVGEGDSESQADWLADKTAHLRIFEDDGGKMNRSLIETGGEALVVSQFTLYGDASRGRRPDFFAAARPEFAEPLVTRYAERLRGLGIPTQTGVFGAMMLVEIHNDGPVTILLEK